LDTHVVLLWLICLIDDAEKPNKAISTEDFAYIASLIEKGVKTNFEMLYQWIVLTTKK
jgi:hypothetical protein